MKKFDIHKREISTDEYNHIMSDFNSIEFEFLNYKVDSKRISLVLEDEVSVIGYASGLIYNKWVYLSDLWIEKGSRSQGLGRKLLDDFENYAKENGCSSIYTWTTGYNCNDLFYTKCGYKIFIEMDGYYSVKRGKQIGLSKELI